MLTQIARGLAVVALAALPAGPVIARSPAHATIGLVPQGANVMLVFANAVAGQDAEFNTWYDTHMQAIMKLPGFVRAQRFQMQPRVNKANPPYGYLIMYEFNGDPDTIIAALGPAVKEGRLQAPDPRWVLKTEAMVYKAVQPGFLGGK